MKIQNSSVAMASSHYETSFSYKESMTMEAAKSKNVAGAILNLSGNAEGKSIKETMVDYQKQEKEATEQKQKENQERSLQQMAERIRSSQTGSGFHVSDQYDMKIKMLSMMLAFLRGDKISEEDRFTSGEQGNVLDLRSAQYRHSEETSFAFSMSGTASESGGSITVGTGSGGTTWQRITATSGFRTEMEDTKFASSGFVQTADGRNIGFNVEVSMSRALMEKIDMLEVTDYIKTDPLMINLDTNVGSVSDQKFFFDLDADGKEEEISFAGKGSGFLALDKNGDGRMNDGSELFGTASGDGFKDLAAYDEDGNGWIDENDSIYSQLKIWTKDENGKDHLIDLKDADVGAIYLGNADTQFSLKNDKNKLKGEIKKTGIYLKESTGAVGTLNHVDLVV